MKVTTEAINYDKIGGFLMEYPVLKSEEIDQDMTYSEGLIEWESGGLLTDIPINLLREYLNRLIKEIKLREDRFKETS